MNIYKESSTSEEGKPKHCGDERLLHCKSPGPRCSELRVIEFETVCFKWSWLYLNLLGVFVSSVKIHEFFYYFKGSLRFNHKEVNVHWMY